MSRKGFRVSVLYLTEQDVERLLPMGDALQAVEAALRDLGLGKAENRPRQRVRGAHAMLNVMPASWPNRGYYGFKEYTVSKEGARFWFQLFDGSTGELLAIMQADRLGQRRTGAASGVATKFLARDDASRVGILGTGWQAESQLEALCRVRPIVEVRCFSPQASRRRTFAERMAKTLGISVRPVDSAEEAIRGMDVVVTATDSPKPVVRGEWLDPGVHVNAIGANRPGSRELDAAAIQRFTFIAADSVEQAALEAGDLITPVSGRILRWEDVHDLASVVCGRVRGRRRAKDVTLFKSLGLALEDVAVGSLVYERARKEGIGTEVSL